MKTYYNKQYFDWQKKAGEYGANQDIWMYEEFINSNDSVLDFGCGGGYMLEKLNCKEKVGVDINPHARLIANQKGIKTYSNLSNIPSQKKFDAIISHHTLEHVENPATILKILRKFLKKNSKVVFVVPIDDWRKQKKYNLNDINKHLYTWTPLLLGNLFSNCGYKIIKIDILQYAWLPLSRFYFKYFPKKIYYFLSWIWSMIIKSRQIRIVAQKSY